MGRINDDGIGTSLHQSLGALQSVGCHAHSSCNAQTAFLVFAGHGLVLGLGYVFIGDETYQMIILVYHWQLLDLVLLQDLGGSGEVGLLMSCHEILAGHHVIDLPVEPTFKAKIPVRNDTNQPIVVVHDGNAADMIVAHHGQRILYRTAQADGYRIVDHSVLCSLHDGHLTRLRFNGHILVNDSDATFTGYGYGHGRFRNGVHRRRYERDVQVNVTRELGFQLYRFRQHLRISGYKQDVVKSQTVHHNFICNK